MSKDYSQIVRNEKIVVCDVLFLFFVGVAPAHEIGNDQFGNTTVRCDNGAMLTIRPTNSHFVVEGIMPDGRTVGMALSLPSGGGSDPAVEVLAADSFANEGCSLLR